MEITVKCNLVENEGLFTFETFKRQYESTVRFIDEAYKTDGFVMGHEANPYLSLMEMQVKALNSLSDAVLSLIHQDTTKSSGEEMWANLKEFPVAKQMLRAYFLNWYSGRMSMKNPYKYADVMEVFLGRMLFYPQLLLPQTSAALHKIVHPKILSGMLEEMKITQFSENHNKELQLNRRKLEWPDEILYEMALSGIRQRQIYIPTVACKCCLRLFLQDESFDRKFIRHPCKEQPFLANIYNVSNCSNFSKELLKRDQTLNEDQRLLLKSIVGTSMNLIAIAPAGCGKSYTTRVAMLHLATRYGKDSFLNLYFTNKMAKENNGETIQSAFKLNRMEPKIYDYIHRLEDEANRMSKIDMFIQEKFPDVESRKKFIIAKVMFIDECGSCSRDLIEFIDQLLRKIRPSIYSDLPFGGMQVILTGDPCQNSPHVDKEFKTFCDTKKREFHEDGFRYFFTSPEMPTYRFMFANFDMLKNNRFKDERFIEFLARARLGEVTEEDVQWLKEIQLNSKVPQAIKQLISVMDMMTHINDVRFWLQPGAKERALNGELTWDVLMRYIDSRHLNDVTVTRFKEAYEKGREALQNKVELLRSYASLQKTFGPQILATVNKQRKYLDEFLSSDCQKSDYESTWKLTLKSKHYKSEAPYPQSVWNNSSEKKLSDSNVPASFMSKVEEFALKYASKEFSPKLKFSVGDILQLTKGNKGDYMNNYDLVQVESIEMGSDGTPAKIKVKMCDLDDLKYYDIREIELQKSEYRIDVSAFRKQWYDLGGGVFPNTYGSYANVYVEVCQFPLLRPSSLTCAVAAGLTIRNGVAWSNSSYIMPGNGYAAYSRVMEPKDFYMPHLPLNAKEANERDFQCHIDAKHLVKFLKQKHKNGLIAGDFYIDGNHSPIQRKWGAKKRIGFFGTNISIGQVGV